MFHHHVFKGTDHLEGEAVQPNSDLGSYLSSYDKVYPGQAKRHSLPFQAVDDLDYLVVEHYVAHVYTFGGGVGLRSIDCYRPVCSVVCMHKAGPACDGMFAVVCDFARIGRHLSRIASGKVVSFANTDA